MVGSIGYEDEHPDAEEYAAGLEISFWLLHRFHGREPNAKVKRRRSPLGRRVPTLAMKMAKPWPVLASA